MSFEITHSAFRAQGIPPLARFVLVCLADFADDTGYCFPSIDCLSVKSGLGQRQVMRYLQRLRNSGHLSILKRGDGRGRANQYRIHPIVPEAEETPLTGEATRPVSPVAPLQSVSRKTGFEEKTPSPKSPFKTTDRAERVSSESPIKTERVSSESPIETERVSSESPIETERVSSKVIKGVLDDTLTIIEPSLVLVEHQALPTPAPPDHPGQATPSTTTTNTATRSPASDPPASLPFHSEAFVTAWQDWVQHRKEIRKPLKPTAQRAQLANLKNMGEADAVTSIRYSISNGYQGLFAPKARASSHQQLPTFSLRPIGRFSQY